MFGLVKYVILFTTSAYSFLILFKLPPCHETSEAGRAVTHMTHSSYRKTSRQVSVIQSKERQYWRLHTPTTSCAVEKMAPTFALEYSDAHSYIQVNLNPRGDVVVGIHCAFLYYEHALYLTTAISSPCVEHGDDKSIQAKGKGQKQMIHMQHASQISESRETTKED